MSILQKALKSISQGTLGATLSEQTQTILSRVTPVFDANLEAYDSGLFRLISNQGSTRSSKTYSICQLLILIANYETKSISITSPSLPHLKRGARKDVLNILDDFNIYDDRNFNMTDQIYSFPETGAYIEFFGVEDSGKVRGPGRDILYENEANLIPFDIHTQLALRTKDMIFIDFNPADDFSWVYDVSDKPGNKLIISTYRNNLSNLTPFQIAEIESLKEQDENKWKVFGLGLRGSSSETIFTHWKICQSLPEGGETIYGQDFGYNVQSGMVQVQVYDGKIYIRQLLYETKLTTSDLIERYKTLEINSTSPIYCDAAEPKTIEELYRAGYNAQPADKDVLEGIRCVKGLQVYITEDSTDLIKEIRNYKWKLDKNEKVLDEPVKFQDHLVDALRYAIFTHNINPEVNWFAE